VWHFICIEAVSQYAVCHNEYVKLAAINFKKLYEKFLEIFVAIAVKILEGGNWN